MPFSNVNKEESGKERTLKKVEQEVTENTR